MGIVTAETLSGVAWILASVWGVVKLIEVWFAHKETLSWSNSEKTIDRLQAANKKIEELTKERDMMRAHFFPEKTEVATEAAAPAKKKRGRPRKYK
jgi:hypothetical protein